MATPFPRTVYDRPWLLLLRGGQMVGKRPSTTLAYAVRPGRRPGFVSCFLINSAGRWSKLPRPATLSTVLATWPTPPTAAALAAARRQLTPREPLAPVILIDAGAAGPLALYAANGDGTGEVWTL